MAKKTIKPTKPMEEALWEACNKLRGSIEPSEYKHVVLSPESFKEKIKNQIEIAAGLYTE